jgi:hypothetical protein
MSIRDSDHYEDSQDMIERIRKLREAAERKMNTFGDPAEYDVRIIRGRKPVAEAEKQAPPAQDSPSEDNQ